MKKTVLNLRQKGKLIFNLFLVCFLIFAIIRTCKAEREFDAKKEALNSVTPAPPRADLEDAEEIAREAEEDGPERVIYLRSKPIIEKIEDKTKADSLAKVANVQAKDITQMNKIIGSLTKENTELKRSVYENEDGKRDTFWRYSDNWLSMEGYRKNDTTFTIQSLKADATVNKIDHTHKKYWLFGREEHRSTVFFNSPYIRVDGLQTLQIKQKDPLLGFNVELEGKYLHAPQEVLIGPKLGIEIGRFKINGGYYVNPGGNIGNSVWYGAGYKIY